MMLLKKSLFPILLLWFICSCDRKDISFGTIPENNYTNLVYTDTVTVNISTVLTDSFATSGDTVFLLGKYSDPYLGTVSAKPVFQLTVPYAVNEIPSTAQFDSLTLIIRPNDYYYGDTSKAQTIYVYELANAISYSYNSQLYNTSDVAVKPTPLGAKIIRIKPRADDSVIIRLNDAKGAELFSKFRQSATEVSSETEFLNYFHGISVSVASDDTTAVFGINAKAGNIVMRLHYHTTIPYPEDHYIDLPSLSNDYAFNQVMTNRTGTGLIRGTTGRTEISSINTNGFSFMQPGTGLLLKMTFPTLSSVLNNENVVKLMRAELLIRPTHLSFDKNKFILPQRLFLTQTDETNIAGSLITDSTGYNVLYADPVTDDIYGENNYYKFNITSYINQLLNTTGSSNKGVFVDHLSPSSGVNVDRLIVNNTSKGDLHSQLLLSFMVINQ